MVQPKPNAPRALAPDPTIYPVEDDVGEDMIQRWIAETLRPLLERWLQEQGKVAFVGADQFIYWIQHHPLRRLSPDVYVLPGVDPTTRVRSWKTWEHGFGPSFALEVVSLDWEKDYVDTHEAYDELGVAEVMVVDPDHGRHPERVLWQVFRRLRGRGLVRIEATNEDRVRSKQLECFLRAVGDGRAMRVRLGVGPRGERLVPTDAERAEAGTKRAEAEARRAEAEAKRAEDATARAAAEGLRADGAEAKLRALEAELRALQAAPRPRRQR